MLSQNKIMVVKTFDSIRRVDKGGDGTIIFNFFDDEEYAGEQVAIVMERKMFATFFESVRELAVDGGLVTEDDQ